MKVKFKKLHVDAKMPFRAHPTDSGADLHAIEDMTLQVGATALIGTGIALELPPGYEAQVRPRSGLSAKHGVMAIFGTVDEKYVGEVKVVITNFGKTYRIHKDDRIAQLVIVPVTTPEFEEVQELVVTDRGTNGFGSSGT